MATPLCILLVDDSEFFTTLERQFLKTTPAKIIVAKDGEEGLRLAHDYRPSLIYLDIDMPKMDGFECCRRIKTDPDLKTIPVVLIGDKQEPTHRDDALAAGADGYLAKPLDRREFLETGHGFLVSIDRREFRQTCQISVLYTIDGVEAQGSCLDISSGGMFLTCIPSSESGSVIELNFTLPDEEKTEVTLGGRICWTNIEGEGIKPDYPTGYGIEFTNIPIIAGIALRRCFGT